MNISINELKSLKEQLFNKNITNEEKELIIKKINEEIEDLFSKINQESEPIDE